MEAHMTNKFLVRCTFAALTLALALISSGCGTPANATATPTPHNPTTLDAQHDRQHADTTAPMSGGTAAPRR